MTGSERSTAPSHAHDADFVAWTRQQAAVLRSLSGCIPDLDAENLADEIEAVGRAELNHASRVLRRILTRLIMLAALPDGEAVKRWKEDALAWQGDAVIACSAGVREHLDLPVIWRLAANAATRTITNSHLLKTEPPQTCPITLHRLLDMNFDPVACAEAIGVEILKAPNRCPSLPRPP